MKVSLAIRRKLRVGLSYRQVAALFADLENTIRLVDGFLERTREVLPAPPKKGAAGSRSSRAR